MTVQYKHKNVFECGLIYFNDILSLDCIKNAVIPKQFMQSFIKTLELKLKLFASITSYLFE